jgi:hypothetical protein
MTGPWLNLRWYPTDREIFAKRALTRNEQTLRAILADADWIFYADCDHVYPPDFFARLAAWLKAHPNETRCITASGKLHTEIAPTDKLVAAEKWAAPYVEKAYERARALPMMRKPDRRIAGGAMQVVSRQQMMELGGYYVSGEATKDSHLFNEYQRARSDIQFRQRVGGSVAINIGQQIHLQHVRDKEQGGKTHLEVQR